MIHFQNVTKKYNKDITALDDVSFEIEQGEFVFLIGSSGSGKTTIIKMLIREEDPSHGKIYFDNEDITRYSRNKIYNLRRKIGVIFQDFKLIEDKTAYENISFVMEAAGHGNKEIRQNVPYLLDIVGLGDRQKSFPRELSGGEKQRIAIARALANNPKLLIADEPTGNLDPESAWDIVQILKKINEWGTTVFMSTHGMDIVKELSRRVLKVQNGLLVSDEAIGDYRSAKEMNKEKFEESINNDLSKIIIPSDVKLIVPEIPSDLGPEEIQDKTRLVDTKVEVESKEGTKNIEKNNESEIKASDEVVEIPVVEPELIESKVDEVTDKDEVVKPESESNKVEEKNEIKEEKTENQDKKAKPRLKISLVSKNKKKAEKESPKNTTKIPETSTLNDLSIKDELRSLLYSSGFMEVEDIIKAGIEEIEKIEGMDNKKASELRSGLAKYIQENL